MPSLLKKYLYYTDKDFLRLFENKTFSTEEEFQNYLVPKIKELLKISNNRIKPQFVITDSTDSFSKRCDIAILSKYGKDRVVLIIELKLEKWFKKFYITEEKGLQAAKNELENYCLTARCDNGILLTDKQCLFFNYEYGDDTSKIKNKFQTRINLPIFILDTPTNKHFLIIMVLLEIIAFCLFTIYLSLSKF